MKNSRYFITYALLLVGQILLCNFLHITPLLYVTMLPAMLLMLPVEFGSAFALVLAFVSGLAVDFFADGVIGLNVAALVPVAYCRRYIIQLVMGREVFARKDEMTLQRQGIVKSSVAIVVATALFMLIYIIADGAGTRPFWFNLVRFVVSLLASSAMGLLAASSFSPEQRDRR